MPYDASPTISTNELVTAEAINRWINNIAFLFARKVTLTIPPIIQAASAATLGDFFTGGFDNTAVADTKFTNFFFIVPDDFASADGIEILIVSNTSTTIEYNITTDYGNPDDNESYNNHSGGIPDQTLVVTANRLTLISISSALASLAAGDFVGVKITTSSGANAATWYVLGARMIYTRV